MMFIDQVVRWALSDDRKVMTKSSAVDLVTQTDQKVEQLIIQSVKEKFPTHRYEAELHSYLTYLTPTTDVVYPDWCCLTPTGVV